MDAVILGGAENNGALKKSDRARYEAEILIHGQPMVEYVISVLERMEDIDRIAVVVPEGLESVVTAGRAKKILLVPPGDNMVDSLLQALRLLQSDQHVLVLTADIPLITVEALRDFLEQCQKRRADVYYSFVPKEIIEEKYQGVKRTYVRLKDGIFTGGNVVFVEPRVILTHRSRIYQAVQLRKRPLKLCRLLGIKFFLRLLVGRLTVSEIEARVEQILKIKGAGVVSLYPEIGIDVDKPSDLELARAVLEKK